MSHRVRVEIRDQLAYVTMTRADKYNGLDLDMLEALVAAAKQVRADKSVRAVILSGEGKVFCAGLDFASVAKQPMRMLRAFLKYGVKSTNLFQEVAWCWRELPVPVIAVLQGRCYGGGLQIALAADFRFATPDCDFSIMEAKWGLIPDMSGTVTLRELMPIDQVKRLTMTAETFNGEQAKAFNLVTELSADPMAAAEALAAQLKARSPDSVAASKSLFQQTWNATVNAAFAVESRIQRKLLMGKNHAIARKANFAKEQPQFLARTFEE